MSLISDQYTSLYVAISALSTAASSTVVLTGILFQNLMLSRYRPFSQIIFYISLCDMMGSAANCLGFPANGSTACTTQAFIFMYFFPASWLWTIMLVYQLRCVALTNKIWLSMKWLHIICWTLPIVPSILPLTTNSYGQDDYVQGMETCTYGGNQIKSDVWIIITLYGSALLCFCVMLLCIANIGWNSFTNGTETTPSMRRHKQSLFYTTLYYPLGMVALWTPMTAVLIYNVNGEYSWATIEWSQALSTQYGTFLAVVFFWNSREARFKWAYLFTKCTGISFLENRISESEDNHNTENMWSDVSDSNESFSTIELHTKNPVSVPSTQSTDDNLRDAY